MGHKNKKGTVSIINAKGRIRLRWRYKMQRHTINLAAFNKQNLIQAKIIALKIEQDILFDNFDATLVSYTGKERDKAKSSQNIVELFEEWVKDYKQMDCEVHTLSLIHI